MSSVSPSLRRPRLALPAGVAAMVAVLAVGILGVVPVVAVTPAVPGPGFVDFQYKPDADGSGGDDVTSYRNQSKVWFNDGKWWGILFDKTGPAGNGTYRIQSFNMATQAWTTSNTATQVDNRNRSNADALWDGTNLFVVSSHDHGRNWASNGDLRLYKYTYNATSKTYAIVAGFPKTLATNGPDPDPVNKVIAASGTLAATIAKAPDGSLWVAYLQQIDPTLAKPAPAHVKVIHSNVGGTTWAAPFVIPGEGNPPTTDDMAAITTVGTAASHRGVGVLWSNQTAGDEAFYFAAHTDGIADGTWGGRETAFGGSGTNSADGHVSVKTDATGRVIAAVKTSRTTGTDPLIDVLARTGNSDAAGTWTNRIVSSVNQHGTRPMLVLDTDNNEANVFITDTTLGAGHYLITRRPAPLDTLAFGAASIGSPFISSTANGHLNNATSTKQINLGASGIIVLAADISTRYYLHGCAGTVCPVVPTADFSGTPLTGEGPLTVDFTDASTGTPATWAWTFGDGGTSTLQNPSHTFNPGTWTVALTVTNAVGTNTMTKTDYVDVSVPTASTYTALDPVARVLDTRVGISIGLSGKFVDSTPRSFQITGHGGVPLDAVAVTGNLTVVNQTKAGYVSLGPDETSVPTSSTINFPKGDNRGNAATIALDGAGMLSAVYKGSAGATTDLVFDVTGYFVRDTAGSTFHEVVPDRVLNTITGVGLGGKFVSSTPRTFQVTGHAGVPVGAVAITGNLAVTRQTKGGYVFLGPTASANPTSSTLNFPAGDVRANSVAVALDGSGQLSAVYKAPTGATTDLVLDITGYFTHDLTGSRYIALEPVRLLNTISGIGLSGKFVSSAPRSWDIADHGGVPVDAVAITGNLAVTGQSKGGYVFLGPNASATPTSSSLNFPVGDVRANGTFVGLSSSGQLAAVYKASAGATTNLVLDVTGYFVP